VLSGPHVGVRFPIVIGNVSRSGVRAEFEQFLTHGAQVSIETEELRVVGTVQNCTEIRTGLFGAGIRVTDLTTHSSSSK
jgi:hypothetical protein